MITRALLTVALVVGVAERAYPDSAAAMQELQVGSVGSFRRVFEVLERASGDDLLVLDGSCGASADPVVVMLWRNPVNRSEYTIHYVQEQRSEAPPSRTVTTDRKHLLAFLGELPGCHDFTLIFEGVSVLVQNDAKGRIRAVSKRPHSSSRFVPTP